MVRATANRAFEPAKAFFTEIGEMMILTGRTMLSAVKAPYPYGNEFIGQFLFAVVRPVWLRLTIGIVFAAPAAVAGYHAVHGIAKHAMPSETWQFIFSAVGAIAIGATAWIRIAGAEPARSGQSLARG